MPENRKETIIALAGCSSYSLPQLENSVYAILDATRMRPSRGARILVKPNLLMSRPLACSHPLVVGATCKWLLDKGAHVTVADSPGFGSPANVAKAIGLDDALAPLGLKTESFKKLAKIKTQAAGRNITIPIAKKALESDMIFSVAKIKAHSQMRMTLCVKNCFGCVPGMRKAFFHALYGQSHEFFAQCLRALWKSLPPVAGIADGVTAMHVTGPSNGEPFALGILGSCANAAALDAALLEAMGIDANLVPLTLAMAGDAGGDNVYPLAKPADFHVNGFIIPHTLKSASFNPFRLAKSCARRIWTFWKKQA